MQGDLWMVVRKLLVGGLVLVLPLLWAVASSQGFWSLGPLGEAWWVLLVVAVVGLGMLAVGGRAVRAREEGVFREEG